MLNEIASVIIRQIFISFMLAYVVFAGNGGWVVSALFDHFSWNASGNNIIRRVFCNNGVCRNQVAFSDGNSGSYYRVSCKPATKTNFYWGGMGSSSLHRAIFKSMVIRRHDNIRGKY